MKTILKFYDYIFFRTYSFFHKKDDTISDEKATNLVVTLQCFLIIDLLIFTRVIFDFEINKQYYNKWFWGLALVLGIGIFNHIRFRNKFKKDNYAKFYSLWANEGESKKKRNGLLIVFYIILSIIGIPVLFAISN